MSMIFVSSALMFAMVALGAFGAHALAPRLEATGHQATWNTAVLYHAIHGLALLAVGIWQFVSPRAAQAIAVQAASWFWIAGIVAFSGSLYLLSLGGPKWLGPVTPLGGVCFLTGWLTLAIAGWQIARASAPAA